MSRHRNAGLLAILLLLLAAIAWRVSTPAPQLPTPAHSTSVQPHRAAAATDQKADAPRSLAEWPTWGGAINSAEETGAGFFGMDERQKFIASRDAGVRKYIVELNARAFLPLAERADAEQTIKKSGGGGGPRILYMQFLDHPTTEQRSLLDHAGVEVLSYVAGYAWLARGSEDAFLKALNFDFVRAVALIDPHDKLTEEMYTGAAPGFAVSKTGQTQFVVTTIPGTTLEQMNAAVLSVPALAEATNGGIRARTSSVLGPRFEIALPGPLQAAALALAGIEHAKFVEFTPPPVAIRDATTDIESDISDVRDNPPNLSGANVSVAVRELGKPDPHTDYSPRLQYITNGDSTAADVDHATAVCGQIASNGTTQPSAKGVAPNANLLAYAVPLSGSGTFSSADVVSAGGKGARLSNHSYGPTGLSTFGDYQTISADWDNAIRSSNLLAMFAGNEEPGQTTNHIDFFVGAKNTICCAATNSTARAGDDNPPIQKSNGISSFSQFGPMKDGRIKPDLVAFGEFVTLDQGTNSTQVKSGTSFSTPAITGVATLAFQAYKAVVGSEPSGALLKALLCNSASDLGNVGPDVEYGFGLVNAKAAVNTIAQYSSSSNSPFFEATLTNGQSSSFTLNLQGAPELKVTLVWMDVSGVPNAAKALVNDLDLTVTDPSGGTHFPFSINPANPTAPATATGPNTVDPIEQVIIPTPADGLWTVTINGTSIPQGPQNFAVCVNVSRLPVPLTASIQASPVSGDAPLTVSFSSLGSTGTISSIKWDFGDGSTDTGATVSHTYTAIGQFTAIVTLTDANGKQASASVTINSSKPHKPTFATKLSASLKFPQKLNDRLMFSLTARNLVKTAQQSREAIRDGTFEGQVYKISINGIAVPTTSPATTIILDRKATFKLPQISVKHSFTSGQIQVTLSKQDLAMIFDRPAGSANPTNPASNPASSGIIPLDVVVETPDAIYEGTFNAFYKTNGKTGSAH